MHPYRDRSDAGVRLAAAFDSSRHGRPDVVVLGLARGGVPVAHEVARALGVPLDVLVVRKADLVVCAATPEPFLAVGAWYLDFSPTTDDEVRRLLAVR